MSRSEGRAPSRRMLRREEARRLVGLKGAALRAQLPETTWTQSRAGWFVPLIFIGACAGFFVWLFSLGDGPIEAAALAIMACILVPHGIGLTFIILRIVNPPWVRVAPAGLTLGGARAFRLAPAPQTYPWGECSKFTVDTIPQNEGSRTVVCFRVGRRTIEIGGHYGDLDDVVTILNKYRSVYGLQEQR